MKTAQTVLLIVLVCALLAGCKAAQPPSNVTATKSASNSNAPDNSNQPARSTEANRNANTPAPNDTSVKTQTTPTLVGAYEAKEVHDKGVVTLMSAISTVIYFAPDGTYSRVSQGGGKIYHRDSGRFRIEAPNKLLLTIQNSDRNIQNPPIEKTHIFTVSPDGEELRLTSEKGAVAVYRRGPATKK